MDDDPFNMFKKFKNELDKHNPNSKKKRKPKSAKQNKSNIAKSKIMSRLKHKSKYLAIEMEMAEEQLAEAKSAMFKAISEYCQKNPEAKNPLVVADDEKQIPQEMTDEEKDEVKTIYREIVKATHPDKAEQNEEELTEMFINATEAKKLNELNSLIDISFDLNIDLSDISIDLIEKLEKELNEKEKLIKEKRTDISVQWFQASKENQKDLIKQICPIKKENKK